MHARNHLKLIVGHKNSHGRIHTHTHTHTKRTDTRTQARTYMYAHMYLHADTHLYPYTHARMYVCAYTYTVQTQIRGALLFAFTISYYYLNKKKITVHPYNWKWSRPVDIRLGIVMTKIGALKKITFYFVLLLD